MRLALVAGLVAALSSSVAAEVPLHHKEWEASAEAYFMTRDERREWALVETEDEAKHFIHAFRARRGPDFAAEVRRRARLVDERLALAR